MKDLIKREDFKEILKVSLIDETKKLLDEAEDKAEKLIEKSVKLQNDFKIIVADQEGQALAAEIFREAKENIDILEGSRKTFTGPLLDVKKRIDEVFANYKGPFLDLVNSMNKAMRDYQDVLEKAKREEEARQRKKMETAVEKGKPIPVMAPPAPVQKTVQSDAGAVTFRDNWKAEIVDKNAAIKYFYEGGQLEMLELNQANLNQMAKQIKTARMIPGIRISNEKVLSR